MKICDISESVEFGHVMRRDEMRCGKQRLTTGEMKKKQEEKMCQRRCYAASVGMQRMVLVIFRKTIMLQFMGKDD